MAQDPRTSTHRWRFHRLGGFDQVIINSADDLRHLSELDQKLWAALSCPTTGVEFDERTLAMLDSDGDGRIRVPEVLAATRWVCSVLKDPAEVFNESDALPLDAIDDSNDEGRQLLASAKRVLQNLGKADTTAITAEETADTAKIFAETRFNGDGVVPPASAADEAIAKAIEDIIASVGSETDRSGAEGISEQLLETFSTEAQAFLEWWGEAEADADNVRPLGDATEPAAAVFGTVKAKIDDYFTRARLVAYDQQAAGFLNPGEADYSALKLTTLSAADVEHGLKRIVVQDQLLLIRLRNNCPAFGGELSVGEGAEHCLLLTWRNEGSEAQLEADLASLAFTVRWRNADGVESVLSYS